MHAGGAPAAAAIVASRPQAIAGQGLALRGRGIRLYYPGVDEAAQAQATSRANAYRQWAYARAWLHARLGDGSDAS